MQWMSPIKPHKRHHDIAAKRLDETGKWFITMPEFRSWMNYVEESGDTSAVKILECYGKPGAGKSVIW